MNNELLTRSITGLVFASIILLSLLFLPVWIFILLLLIIVSYITLIELPSLANPRVPYYWLLLLFYIIIPFGLMIFMSFSIQYKPYLILIFILAFCHDTLAYTIGKLFGRHKIAPSLSPNKTWEGFFGGIIGSMIALLIYPVFYLSTSYLFLYSLFFALIATLGDLFESWLKRKAHKKDTGSLLPGHGGLLDRFDSIIFLTVAILIFFIS